MVTQDDEVREIARRVAGNCVGQRARQLSRVASRIYDDELRPFGVSNSQVGLLTAVHLAGPVHPGKLGDFVAAEKSTVSRNIRVMIERGWVQESDAAGEPGKLLELTAAGKSLLAEIGPAWERAQRKALSLFGSDASAVLDELLADV